MSRFLLTGIFPGGALLPLANQKTTHPSPHRASTEQKNHIHLHASAHIRPRFTYATLPHAGLSSKESSRHLPTEKEPSTIYLMTDLIVIHIYLSRCIYAHKIYVIKLI